MYTQSVLTLSVIRVLTGPTIAVLLISAIIMAWSYPLNRDRQNRIRRMLQRRQAKRAARKAAQQSFNDGKTQ